MGNYTNGYFIIDHNTEHVVNKHADFEQEVFPISKVSAFLKRLDFLTGGLDAPSKVFAAKIMEDDLSMFDRFMEDRQGGTKYIRFGGNVASVTVSLGREVATKS